MQSFVSFFGESLISLTENSDQDQATIAHNITQQQRSYMNFALMNCGTFHAIFINLVKVTGLKP